LTPDHRLKIASQHFDSDVFRRMDYLGLFPNLSTATASRDLRHGVEGGCLRKEGEHAMIRYRVVSYLERR